MLTSENDNQQLDRAQELTIEQFGEYGDSNVPQSPDKLESENDEQLSHQSPPRTILPVSRSRLYLMVMADFGLAFVWLCKFAVATPYFQHSLKAGPFLSHLVWIMGPLSGLIVAPVVGVLSDRCTSSFGRRRPFMAGGTICCIIGMNIFANASRLTFGFLPAARLVAVLAFGVLDFATNAIMFPSRALLGDLLPPEQQHPVQSAAAVIASLAEISGGVFINLWDDPVTNVSTIFMVASFLLAFTAAISLYICKEKPLSLQPIPTTDGLPDDFILPESVETNHISQISDNINNNDESEHNLISTEQETKVQVPNVLTNANTAGPSNISNGERNNTEDIQTKPVNNEELSEQENGNLNEEIVSDDNDDDDVEAQLSITNSRETNETEPTNIAAEPGSIPVSNVRESIRAELVESIRKAIRDFPRELVWVGIVYGLAWFVWFAALPSYSQWLGSEVLGGDAHAATGTKAALQYEKGVRLFSVANAAKAVLAMGFSFFYPSIIKWVGAIGERVVFGSSFLIFSIVLYMTAYTKDVLVASSVIALGSVPFIVTQTIPIAIVVQRYPEHLASNLGVMNLFCVIPQLVDTLYTGKVAELAGESAVLRIASIWGFAASIAAFLFL